jgi:Amt family ammonium transporter
VGLFATEGGLFFGGGFSKLLVQLVGIAGTGALVFSLSLVVWLVIKATMGVRVSANEETEGLDSGEHGMEAYPGFVQHGQDLAGGSIF